MWMASVDVSVSYGIIHILRHQNRKETLAFLERHQNFFLSVREYNSCLQLLEYNCIIMTLSFICDTLLLQIAVKSAHFDFLKNKKSLHIFKPNFQDEITWNFSFLDSQKDRSDENDFNLGKNLVFLGFCAVCLRKKQSAKISCGVSLSLDSKSNGAQSDILGFGNWVRFSKWQAL